MSDLLLSVDSTIDALLDIAHARRGEAAMLGVFPCVFELKIIRGIAHWWLNGEPSDEPAVRAAMLAARAKRSASIISRG